MADEQQALRDWHRLFGMLLSDFFTDSPFVVEVERDLSVQQQLLDVVIVRRGRGRFASRLPDGLEDLTTHNLITFKSHHESLDAWAMKELMGHYVAYRKLVSKSTSELLPEGQFRLYAVCARYPQNVLTQVQWQNTRAGVYDCRWGTDTIRIIVAGQLSHEAQNAPLHLFSASTELIGIGQVAYRRRSARTSSLLNQLFDRLKEEGFTMSFTWQDYEREYVKRYFPKLPLHEQEELVSTLPLEARLAGLPPEARLAGLPPEVRFAGLSPEALLDRLSEEQIRAYLDKRTTRRKPSAHKPRRKK